MHLRRKKQSPLLAPALPAVPLSWLGLLQDWLGVPAPVATALWRRYQGDASLAWQFRVIDAKLARGDPRRGIALAEMVPRLSPARFMDELERLVQAGTLTRKAASSIEERFLTKLNAQGNWA